MGGRSSRRRVAAAVAVAMLAASCGGGGESSGLPTLVGAATTAPATGPERIEPVSEPTAVTSLSSEAAGAAEPLSSAEADAVDSEASETVAAAEPQAIAGEEPAAPDEGGEEAAEPEVVAGEEVAEPEAVAGEEPIERDDLTDEERLLAFAECMRENGVDFPDPVVEADGTVIFGFRPGRGGGFAALQEIGRDPDLPAARDACQGLVAGVAFGPGQGGFDMIEIQDALLEFARCMRDNGVDIGDPDMSVFAPGASGGDQPGGPFRGVIDLDDPDLASAFAICQQQLPGAGQGASFGGGS